MTDTTLNVPLLFTCSSDTLRVILRDGNPWFVATDVASALEYRDAPTLTRILDDDEKGTHNLRTNGGNQEVTIISESGLYAAILKSRKPEAKKFRKWITNEVLPSIRKRGVYFTEQTHLQNHAANLRILGEAANALADAALKLATEYEQYDTSATQMPQPPQQPQPQSLIPPREIAFIQAWWDCLGSQTVTASDLYRAVATKQCQELNDKSSALLGDISQWTPKKLSHALRRWSQTILNGYAVQNIGRTSHGILWRLQLLLT